MQWCLSEGRVCALFISHCGGEGLPSSPVHLPSLSPTKPVRGAGAPSPGPREPAWWLSQVPERRGGTDPADEAERPHCSSAVWPAPLVWQISYHWCNADPHVLHNRGFHVLVSHPHGSFSKESVQIVSFFLIGVGASYIKSPSCILDASLSYDLQIFSPRLWFIFSFSQLCLLRKRTFHFNEVWIKNIFFYRLYICYSN